MKKTLIIAGVILLIVVVIAGGQLLFKGANILQLGAEKSLQIARSQVEKALPETYPADKIKKEFDAVLGKAKAGQINSGELKNFLLWLPTKLKNTKLDSIEVDNLITRLHKIVEVK
ncbi:hypothetical protein H8E88_24055 [candidate division KSB1 bacterium]|nr:hypothetical protein [candidate division KSB1 bacterium]